MDHVPLTQTTLVVAIGVVYLSIVHRLRYYRLNTLRTTYAKRHGLDILPSVTREHSDRPPTKAEYPMTPAEAQEIIKVAAGNEFPFVVAKSMEFALFKTYGIPTIASLLYHTSEFTDRGRAGRRYADTTILIASWITYPIVGPESGAEVEEGAPLDPRSALAVARTNWLHGRYGTKISNDDLLYTLTTFILEPKVWLDQFEWRTLIPLEEVAFLVFWREIGRRMGIKDIPEEIGDIVEWAEEYEKKHMVPNESCRDVAAATTRLLLHNVPEFLRPFGEKVVACLLYDRLRESIMVPPPPPLLKTIVQSTLRARGFFIRHCLPPRPRLLDYSIPPRPEVAPAFPKGYVPLSKAKENGMEADGKEKGGNEEVVKPRTHLRAFDNEPWYVAQPSFVTRLVNSTLLAVGIKREDQVPGAERWKPEGYRLEEVGPAKLEQKGQDEVKRIAVELQGAPLEGPYAIGGVPVGRCPFAFAT